MAAELKTRADFGSFLNELRLQGSAVEIGAYRGDFARQVLAEWRGERWYMVDPWQVSEEFLLRNGGVEWEMENARRSAEELAAEDGRAILTEAGDPVAERAIPDRVDAAYLDALHDTASVLADLEDWWPRVAPGGVLAGHDYLDQWRWSCDINAGVLFGVKTAVDHFARRHGRVVASTNEEFPTWWFRKPIGEASSIGVVSGSTLDVPWRNLAKTNHGRYCGRHGYAYRHADLRSDDVPPHWQKIPLVREALEESEWVLWIDADALFQDPTVRLERFWDGSSSFLWMKDEINGLNTGVFFARRCPEAFDFLDEWEAMGQDDEWRDHRWRENGAAIELERRGRLPGLVLPHRMANSYPHIDGEWAAGDFVFHCAGLLPPVRNALLQDLAFRAELVFSEAAGAARDSPLGDERTYRDAVMPHS